MKRAQLATAAGAVILLFSCTNPFARYDRTETTPGFGQVKVSAGISTSRTVVPDFSSAIDSFEVVLTSHDGYAAKSATVTVPATSYTFDSVETGTWDIAVTAEKDGNTVAEGSATGQTIEPGTTLTVAVPIVFSQSGGTGSLSLAISFPTSTGIDYVEGAVDGGTAIVPVLTESAGQFSATFTQGGLSVGAHDLVMTFRRGGAGGTKAGVFREAVNIWANTTSDMWIDANGQPVAVRVFSADEFPSAIATLANLQISAGWINFDSVTLGYDAGIVADAQVTIVATESLLGQQIRYRIGGAVWTDLRSDATSAPIALAPGANTIEVWVVAPDHATSATYSIGIARGFRVIYDGNGNTSGVAPVDPVIHLASDSAVVLGPGALANPTYTFTGWNTTPDSSGTNYAVGSTITTGATAITLYARWQVTAPIFSVAGGTYDGPQTVGISSATANASIRFTLDGSEPTSTHGTLGSSADITEAATLRAIAFEAGRVSSDITQASYVLTGGVTVTFAISTPDLQAITFQSSDVIVPRGDTLQLTTTNGVLVGLSDWKWYVDDQLAPTQTSSTFSWDTSGADPGQYIINVTVVYGNVRYSGSLRATVTY